MNSITVLIADDCPIAIDGLQCILHSCPDIEVVGVAVNGLEALDKAQKLRPGVVLLDAQMPGIDSVETIRRFKRLLPGIKILLMVVHVARLDAALDAGADGFIMKDSNRQELVDSIRNLALQPQLL